MALKAIETVSIRQVKAELNQMLREVERGVQYIIRRRTDPIGALISHEDFRLFQELIHKESLAEALLRGKGFKPSDLTTERFIDLLDMHLTTKGAE